MDDEQQSPTEGQAELIIAKHRNGGLDNIRLKFIGSLGKFENLDNSFGSFEFESKMNEEKPLPRPDNPFNTSGFDGDDDMPF